ncbi:PE-PPE domain-containing protein [Mycolicibacterium litorale]|uniref:PE-PPE domain-containing protein n=1 Tax=Mycolicibacterium litorale TaxID=758802 RepID=UPI003CEF3911
MAKLRSRAARKCIKKAAVAGGAAAAATALTMGLTAPSAAAAAAASQVRAQEVNLAALEDANLGFLLDALGIDLPSLDQLLPIPTTIPGTDIELPVNVITTGPPFGALALFGLNPFWVPALPSAIADEINGTPYGGIDTEIGVPLPESVYQAARAAAFLDALARATRPVAEGGGGCSLFNVSCQRAFANAAANAVPRDVTAPIQIPNLRIPIVLAFGLGSLATGMAYPDVVADLPNQPGGTGEGAEPGTSLTILPLILLRNPGRADGGIAARFAPVLDPILGLFGQNSVVTPDVDVETDGGAVLVPIKVDATVEYDPLSDFAAWPNPFTLANNGAAFLFPTYILRGADLTGALPEILEPVLGSVLTNVISAAIGDGLTVSGIPILGDVDLPREFLAPLVEELLGVEIPSGEDGFYEALNAFITVESDALPLLEPFRYPTDFANLFTGGVFGFTNPFADAIEPALKILTNLGYTNVTQNMSNPLDPYPRDFTGNYGSEYAPFFTFPENVDWGRVPADLVTAFAAGVQNSFFTGIPGVRGPLAGPNPLAILAGLLGLPTGPADLPDLLNAFPGLADIIGADLGLPDLNSASTLAAAAAPAGGSDDPLTRLGETLARTLNIAFEREAPVDYTPPTSPVDSAFDVAEGLGASGLRLLAATVLGPTRLAALAEGGPEALADLIENTVDAPLWIADPALYGLRDALPADAAGNVTAFRDNLWALTERINEALLGALDELPVAPADVRVANDGTQGGVTDPEVEATLRAAGPVSTGQPADQGKSDPPSADTSGDAPKDILLEGDKKPASNDDQKVVDRGPQFKGGQLSKAIERSVDRVGDRLNDAADNLRDGIKKALTPPSKKTPVDNDTDSADTNTDNNDEAA